MVIHSQAAAWQLLWAGPSPIQLYAWPSSDCHLQRWLACEPKERSCPLLEAPTVLDSLSGNALRRCHSMGSCTPRFFSCKLSPGSKPGCNAHSASFLEILPIMELHVYMIQSLICRSLHGCNPSALSDNFWWGKKFVKELDLVRTILACLSKGAPAMSAPGTSSEQLCVKPHIKFLRSSEAGALTQRLMICVDET